MNFFIKTKSPKSERSKFNSRKIEIDGITFDSIKEAKRYKDLKLMLKAGTIQDLEIQVPFILQNSYTRAGKTVRPITYIADFQYKENGQIITEDCKGYRTTEYKLKKKILLFKFSHLNFIET